MNTRFGTLRGESWTSGYRKTKMPYSKTVQGRQGSKSFVRDTIGGLYFRLYLKRLRQEMVDYQSKVLAQHALDRQLNRNL
jgi:hypothetical protein